MKLKILLPTMLYLAVPVAFCADMSRKDLLLFESFNETTGTLEENRLQMDAAKILPRNGKDSALFLNGKGYAELTAPVGLTTKAGTISFWVKPLWKEPRTSSQTFLSMKWSDNKHGYMVISDGWWEPTGANRLYFILNNQEPLHCSTSRALNSDVWTLITATWATHPNRYCKLYIDAERFTQSSLPTPATNTYSPASALFIGTDKGAANRRGRFAHALIDDIKLYDRPLSDREVFNVYNSYKTAVPASERQDRWLNEDIPRPKQQLRDASGTLLESRIIFDEGWQWALSKTAIDQKLDKIKKAGFNVYVPCVWHGRGARFPTRLAYIEPRLKAAFRNGFDPLAYLVERAHSMGVEVHPWFTVARRETDHYPDFFDEGTPDTAYDVHKKDFRTFITTLILDVATRYNIDGINLDYIRTMGICTSQSCQRDYLQRAQHRLMGDYYLRPLSAASRKRIQQWQDHAVTEIVRQVSSRAHQARPGIVISADGHPRPSTEKRNLQGQDEILWANNGWIDKIFLMDYHRNIDYKTADVVRAELNDPNDLTVLFGNYDRLDNQSVPRSGNLVASYAEFAQHTWPGSGVAFYIFTQMTDEQVASLRSGPFKEDAQPYWSSNNQNKDD